MASKRKFEGPEEGEGRFQKKLSCSDKGTDKGSPLLNLPRELRDQILFEACRDRVVEIGDADVGSMTNMTRWPGGLGKLLVQSTKCRRKHNEDRIAGDRTVIELCYDPALNNDDNGHKESVHDRPRPGSRRNLPLLYVCHQVQGEASIAANITYTSNEFSFHTVVAFMGFAAMIGEKDLTAIRKVRIRLLDDSDDGHITALWFIKGILCDSFSGLGELQLQFVGGHSRSLVPEEFSARLVRAERKGICGHMRISLLMVDHGPYLSDAASDQPGILVHCKGIHFDTFIRRHTIASTSQKIISAYKRATMGQPSPLLQLPREIRDQIWLGVCGKRSVVIDDSDKKTPNSDRIGLCNTLPLFHVCRQIQDEVTMAAGATYTSNEFCFATTSAFAAFASQAADGDVAAIEKVRVRISRHVGKDLDHIQKIISQSLAGLRELLLYCEQTADEFLLAEMYSMRVIRTIPGAISQSLRRIEEDESESDLEGEGHAISVEFHGIPHFFLDWHFAEPSQGPRHFGGFF